MGRVGGCENGTVRRDEGARGNTKADEITGQIGY